MPYFPSKLKVWPPSVETYTSSKYEVATTVLPSAEATSRYRLNFLPKVPGMDVHVSPKSPDNKSLCVKKGEGGREWISGAGTSSMTFTLPWCSAQDSPYTNVPTYLP